MGKIAKYMFVALLGLFVFTSCVKPTPEVDQIGNTSGNLNNGSKYVMVDGWVYYTELEVGIYYLGAESKSNIGGFWKMRPDFSQRQRISVDYVEGLYVVGSKIYTKSGFVYDTIKNTYQEAEWAQDVYTGGAYSLLFLNGTVYFGENAIDLDGKNPRVFAEGSTVTQLDYSNGWIYFNDPNLGDRSLCKIKPDGTGKTVVATGVVNEYVIVEDKLYYSNTSDNGTLYVLDLKTYATEKLSDRPVHQLNYYEGKLYYLNREYLDGVYMSEIDRINTDGTGYERILTSSAGLDQLSILDGWLYYGGLSLSLNDGPHYRMSLRTGEIQEQKIDVAVVTPITSDQTYVKGDAELNFFAEKDGWLYFSKLTADTDRGIYRMKPDGSDVSKISDEAALSMLIVEDWIYFSNFDYRMMLFRMRLDGSDVELVSSKSTGLGILKDEWLYVSSQNELFRVRTDGTGYMKLSNAIRFRIAGEKIIVGFEETAGSGVLTMDLDGKNKVEIYTGINSILDVSEEWIYFVKHDGFGNNDGFTYRMKHDGSMESIMDDSGGFSWMTHHNGWYYALSDDSKTITRLRADGTQRSVIINLPIRLADIDIVLDRIIISIHDDESQKYSVESYDLEGRNKIELSALTIQR